MERTMVEQCSSTHLLWSTKQWQGTAAALRCRQGKLLAGPEAEALPWEALWASACTRRTMCIFMDAGCMACYISMRSDMGRPSTLIYRARRGPVTPFLDIPASKMDSLTDQVLGSHLSHRVYATPIPNRPAKEFPSQPHLLQPSELDCARACFT
eukprot:1139838-Pelagomonas_calceolata.AAC.6